MKRFARLVFGLALLALAAVLVLRPAAVPPKQPEPPLIGMVDRVVLEKASRQLTLWQGGKAVRRYPVALGFAPKGDKLRQGDGRTPEGVFRINRRNDRSKFHLSLGLDYPQPDDLARAEVGGYDPGGDIMLHGQPNSMPVGMKAKGDWTAGCIALTNDQIEEIWRVTQIGTVVEIRP